MEWLQLVNDIIYLDIFVGTNTPISGNPVRNHLHFDRNKITVLWDSKTTTSTCLAKAISYLPINDLTEICIKLGHTAHEADLQVKRNSALITCQGNIESLSYLASVLVGLQLVITSLKVSINENESDSLSLSVQEDNAVLFCGKEVDIEDSMVSVCGNLPKDLNMRVRSCFLFHWPTTCLCPILCKIGLTNCSF